MKRTMQGGFTLVEIMIVVAIIALLAAIAIPNVLRGRTSANETASIGNMRALVSSMEMYRSVQGAYPDTPSWQLMYPAGGAPAFAPPSFNTGAPASLANYQLQGYQYTYTAAPGGACTDAALDCQTYSVTANPLTLNRTGTRAFFVSEAGTVTHVLGAGPATATCPSIDAAPGAAGC